MKRFLAFVPITALAAIVFLSAHFVMAGPIVPKEIGADAKWFGHVNCEAIRSMELVWDLKDECPMCQQCQAKMGELTKKVGMNPMEDVLGATLYPPTEPKSYQKSTPAEAVSLVDPSSSQISLQWRLASVYSIPQPGILIVVSREK